MNSFFGLNWISYFCTGLVMLVVSSLMSGCRFGNQEVSQPQTADEWSGNYEMPFSTLKYCATNGTTSCVSLAASKIPDPLGSVFSNPVRIQQVDPTEGKIYFYDPLHDGPALGIYHRSGVISGHPPDVIYSPAWSDPGCTEVDAIHVEGAIARTPGSSQVMSGLSISGKVTLRYTSTITFQGVGPGACSSTLQAMAACYNDFALCGGGDATANGKLQAAVHQLFDPYIDAGVVPVESNGSLNPAVLSGLAQMAWELTYQ